MEKVKIKVDPEIQLVCDILEQGSEKIGYLIPKRKFGYKEPLENLYQYYLSGNTYELMIKRIEQLEKDLPEICKLVPKLSKKFTEFVKKQVQYKHELVKKGSF